MNLCKLLLQFIINKFLNQKMKIKGNSKYINFYFKNYLDFPKININSLPKMKKSKTNKDMNSTYNQEEINKRILRKINYNYIINQFNLYCKKSRKRYSSKYISSISEDLYNNTNRKNFSRNKKSNFNTQINFFKSSNYDLLSNDTRDKDNFYEDEKIYDFRQKFSGEFDKIAQLKNMYKFYNLPKYIKDEISTRKIKKVFTNNDFDFDLNNKFKPKIRIIAKIKNHSFNEKFPSDNNKTKTVENKIYKKNKNIKCKVKINKSNNVIDINKFIKNDLQNLDYFNSVSTTIFKKKSEKPIKIINMKSNFLCNYMKLTKKPPKYKLFIKSE